MFQRFRLPDAFVWMADDVMYQTVDLRSYTFIYLLPFSIIGKRIIGKDDTHQAISFAASSSSSMLSNATTSPRSTCSRECSRKLMFGSL